MYLPVLTKLMINEIVEITLKVKLQKAIKYFTSGHSNLRQLQLLRGRDAEKFSVNFFYFFVTSKDKEKILLLCREKELI